MDYLRGIAIIWSLCVLVLPGMYIGYKWVEADERREEEDRRLIEQRRREFAEDIEQCGQRMRNADRVREILNTRKQTIKYTGLFSGEDVERKLNNERGVSCAVLDLPTLWS